MVHRAILDRFLPCRSRSARLLKMHRLLRISMAILVCIPITVMIYKLHKWHEDSLLSIRMGDRIAHLKSQCHNLKLSDAESSVINYFASPQYSTAWCGSYNSLSTSWMSRWLGFNNKRFYNAEKKFLRNNMDVYFEGMDLGRLRSMLFMVLLIQHPFERLVDIFINHIHEADVRTELFVTRMTIAYKHRKGNYMLPLTFQEYIDYVLERSKAAPLQLEPFFQRISTLCAPCGFHYGAIIDSSTYYEEESYVIRHSNLSGVMRPDRWLSSTTERQTRDLFAGISKEQKMALYDFYRPDFDLFGYQADKYM